MKSKPSCQTSPLTNRAIAESRYLVDILVSLRKKREVKKAFRKKKNGFDFLRTAQKNLNCKSNSLTHFLSKILKLSQNFSFRIYYIRSLESIRVTEISSKQVSLKIENSYYKIPGTPPIKKLKHLKQIPG